MKQRPKRKKTLADHVREYEMSLIRAALERTGSVDQAAKVLGISRATLFRKKNKEEALAA